VSSNKHSELSVLEAHSPAGFRCLISALAIAMQVTIFAGLRLLNCLPQHLLHWCWVIALDVGFTFGVYGLCSARKWSERILAVGLIGFQFILLWILFLMAVANYLCTHSTTSIH
jgi:hypothetical protein